MCNLLTETVISVPEVVKLVPRGRGGREIHKATAKSWMKHGIRLSSGHTVRLEAARIGGRWVTTREAVERFLARVASDCVDAPQGAV